MLKCFILILIIVGNISLIRQYSPYNKAIRKGKKGAYLMYKNRYFRNKILDITIIVLFFVLILLTILVLGL
jgi:hypothetical protein